jgi:hypothetical protein
MEAAGEGTMSSNWLACVMKCLRAILTRCSHALCPLNCEEDRVGEGAFHQFVGCCRAGIQVDATPA